MKIESIIVEEINLLIAETKEWYHGTPDVRGINDSGSFVPKTNTTRYIADFDKWSELQNELKQTRETNRERYFKILDELGSCYKDITYNKPIFFTDSYNVAKTYATDKKAFDYQESIPKTLSVHIDETGANILKIPAHGLRFRKIEIPIVKSALSNAGISDEEIQNKLNMIYDSIRGAGNLLSTDDLGLIAQLLCFDIVDVIGVLDSYHGGNTKSTVRMVFDSKRIKIN